LKQVREKGFPSHDSQHIQNMNGLGINWNDYPDFFKKGSYIQRKRVSTKFTANELEKLPINHNARKNPDMLVDRWIVDVIDIPPLSKVSNRVNVIIFGEAPL